MIHVMNAVPVGWKFESQYAITENMTEMRTVASRR